MAVDFGRLLALLYGRWYQEAYIHFASQWDPFELDPAGRRFLAPSLRAFLEDWGYGHLNTPDFLAALLVLRREDLEELIFQEGVKPEDVVSRAALVLLGDYYAQLVECWEERELSPSRLACTLLHPEGWEQRQPLAPHTPGAIFFRHSLPASAAVLVSAWPARKIRWRLDWADEWVLQTREEFWGLLLQGQDPWWARGKQVEVGPVTLPRLPVRYGFQIHKSLTHRHWASIAVEWRGHRVWTLRASVKFVDVVTEALERVAPCPDGVRPYSFRSYTFAGVLEWLRNGHLPGMEEDL